MVQVIEHIIYALVDDKDGVKFDVREDGDNVTVTVHVKETDMGRVIGKEGGTVNAIRTILKNCNAPDGKRYFIQIGERKQPRI